MGPMLFIRPYTCKMASIKPRQKQSKLRRKWREKAKVETMESVFSSDDLEAMWTAAIGGTSTGLSTISSEWMFEKFFVEASSSPASSISPSLHLSISPEPFLSLSHLFSSLTRKQPLLLLFAV